MNDLRSQLERLHRGAEILRLLDLHYGKAIFFPDPITVIPAWTNRPNEATQ